MFSSNLENALKEVLPSDDPLDRADFDPVKYINNIFPDEDSLSEGNLEEFLQTLRDKVGAFLKKLLALLMYSLLSGQTNLLSGHLWKPLHCLGCRHFRWYRNRRTRSKLFEGAYGAGAETRQRSYAIPT